MIDTCLASWWWVKELTVTTYDANKTNLLNLSNDQTGKPPNILLCETRYHPQNDLPPAPNDQTWKLPMNRVNGTIVYVNMQKYLWSDINIRKYIIRFVFVYISLSGPVKPAPKNCIRLNPEARCLVKSIWLCFTIVIIFLIALLFNISFFLFSFNQEKRIFRLLFQRYSVSQIC